jgi:hypothetical protein
MPTETEFNSLIGAHDPPIPCADQRDPPGFPLRAGQFFKRAFSKSDALRPATNQRIKRPPGFARTARSSAYRLTCQRLSVVGHTAANVSCGGRPHSQSGRSISRLSYPATPGLARESPLLACLEVVNRRITTLSEGKTDPFHDEIMNFAAFLEGSPAERFIDWVGQI